MEVLIEGVTKLLRQRIAGSGQAATGNRGKDLHLSQQAETLTGHVSEYVESMGNAG